MSEKLLVSLERVIDAPAKDLFEAWLDPEAMAQFLKPGANVTTREISVDARVGGRFRLTMRAGETDIPIHGEYQRIDRHTHLAFTWLSSFTTPGSLVTLEFEALAPSRTRLSLRHVGFPNDDERGSHEDGWTQILAALATYARR